MSVQMTEAIQAARYYSIEIDQSSKILSEFPWVALAFSIYVIDVRFCAYSSKGLGSRGQQTARGIHQKNPSIPRRTKSPCRHHPTAGGQDSYWTADEA